MIKLTLHFKTGKTINLKCESYAFSYDRITLEFNGYTIEGDNPKVSFVPSQLEAYEAVD